MKTFLTFTIVLLLLLGITGSVSAFLGRDLLNQLKDFAGTQIKKGTSIEHGKVINRFAVFSDTHSDQDSTYLALEQAKKLGIDYIVHTGDWTTVGTVEELSKQKQLFDEAKIPYWGIMGDHDRWQSGVKNFTRVFGSAYESFEKNGFNHILLDSSDIENGLGEGQLNWLAFQMEKTNEPTLIFLHLPIYHPTSDRTIQSKAGSSPVRSKETETFISLIKGKNILAMFSGDHHFSTSYTEPESGVRIIISGAVTADRNLQKPRFTLVEIYEDLFIKTTDQIIGAS